jgi:hypothetical protein
MILCRKDRRVGMENEYRHETWDRTRHDTIIRLLPWRLFPPFDTALALHSKSTIQCRAFMMNITTWHGVGLSR